MFAFVSFFKKGGREGRHAAIVCVGERGGRGGGGGQKAFILRLGKGAVAYRSHGAGEREASRPGPEQQPSLHAHPQPGVGPNTLPCVAEDAIFL